MLLARGLIAFLAFTVYYLALQLVPLPEAASVYMTAPLLVTIYSALILRERVGAHRWGAVAVGFAAVLMALNPGSAVFRIEAAMPLFSAMCYALIPILNRHIGMSEHALTMGLYTIASYLVLISLLGLAANLGLVPTLGLEALELASRPWTAVAAVDLALLAVVAVLFCLGLLGITQAYRIAQV